MITGFVHRREENVPFYTEESNAPIELRACMHVIEVLLDLSKLSDLVAVSNFAQPCLLSSRLYERS